MVKGTAELQRPVPLYMQVVRQLRAQIASGELAEGERIPSQREMMQIWRISMQTASKVIGALKTEGLAIPSIGRDTIVAPGAPARIAAATAGTARATANRTADINYDVAATAELIAAPADVAEALGIPSGHRALRREETSLENGKPVSLIVTWFPETTADGAPRIADSEPLPSGALAYLAEAIGSRVTHVIEDRAALPADELTSQCLNVSPGSPVLVTKSRLYGAEEMVIAYSQSSLPADTWYSFSYAITGTT